VIHAGYEALFDRHPDARETLLLGGSFGDDYPVLKKEIRALGPEAAARYVRQGRPAKVRVVERADLPEAVTADLLVVPDEEIMRDVVVRYKLESGRTVVWERTFLRWD